MSDIPKNYTDIVAGLPDTQTFNGDLTTFQFTSATGYCSGCGLWYWGWPHTCLLDRHDRQEGESHHFQQGTGDKKDLLWCPGCGKVKRFAPKEPATDG